ncbi:MAG: 50S ribosomal protein L5 [Kiritimatiellae bacterium]|jgi:large subunit ribosomal protein L5|nr:50S ribosomal protein L5 [Kiritimatiellia bacterium]
MARLKDKYVKEWAPALQKKLEISNKMVVPALDKIVVNMGFGIVEKDVQKKIIENLGALTGQRPVLCKARNSISNFKLRDGMIIGAKVTLRGDRMYEFADRLINSALPRIRDFRGVPTRGFDGRGNYTMGLKEHSIFPEIVDTGNHAVDVGMDISFITIAKNDAHARELLEIMGMPFAGR